jgi:hypothetical protein
MTDGRPGSQPPDTPGSGSPSHHPAPPLLDVGTEVGMPASAKDGTQPEPVAGKDFLLRARRDSNPQPSDPYGVDMRRSVWVSKRAVSANVRRGAPRVAGLGSHNGSQSQPENDVRWSRRARDQRKNKSGVLASSAVNALSAQSRQRPCVPRVMSQRPRAVSLGTLVQRAPGSDSRMGDSRGRRVVMDPPAQGVAPRYCWLARLPRAAGDGATHDQDVHSGHRQSAPEHDGYVRPLMVERAAQVVAVGELSCVTSPTKTRCRRPSLHANPRLECSYRRLCV